MSDSVTLSVESRSKTGSKVSRSLRKNSKVPGILYAHGQPAELITLDPKEVLNAVRAGKTVVSISLANKAEQAIIREVQWDHLGREILHVDLGRVSADEKIKVHIPIVTKGMAPGVNAGGVLDITMHNIDIECLVTQVPQNIAVNISELQIGDSIHVRDLQLAPGIRALNDPDLVVLHVVTKREEEIKPADGSAPEPEVLTKKKTEETKE